MKDNTDNNGGSNLVAGLAVGLVAGVALGVLLSPKEGRETRAMVQEAISNAMERVRRQGGGSSGQG